MTADEFAHYLTSDGFAPAVKVEREAHGMMDHHTHPFEAKALILNGDICIVTAVGERTYQAGDIFHLRAEEPHTEYYGTQGVIYLVGRKT